MMGLLTVGVWLNVLATVAIGVGLYRWIQRTDPPVAPAEAIVPNARLRSANGAAVVSGDDVVLHLVGEDGEVRHEVHTSDPTIPPRWVYGGRTYVLVPTQTQPGVVVYVEQTHG